MFTKTVSRTSDVCIFRNEKFLIGCLDECGTRLIIRMNLPFHKFQGTGNDFVLVDQRSDHHLTRADTERIRHLCDRRFGVGADGLILLQLTEGYDFEMVYFNADGRESTLCGNGGRCTVQLAHQLGLFDQNCRFLAIDGAHDARRMDEPNWIALKMNDVTEVQATEDHFVLDTGSPHFVTFVEDLRDLNIRESGALIRYSAPFKQEGINVNFVENRDGTLHVGTYERGVEDETLSCGTGVTAAAIAYARQVGLTGRQITVPIQTKGGRLQIRLTATKAGATDIWLCGPAVKVFDGCLTLFDVV